MMYIKEQPFSNGVSKTYQKATIDTYLTETEATKEEDYFTDMYPRYNHLQEQQRADNVCDLIFHSVQCYKTKGEIRKNK
jgi:hypothetical protein